MKAKQPTKKEFKNVFTKDFRGINLPFYCPPQLTKRTRTDDEISKDIKEYRDIKKIGLLPKWRRRK